MHAVLSCIGHPLARRPLEALSEAGTVEASSEADTRPVEVKAVHPFCTQTAEVCAAVVE